VIIFIGPMRQRGNVSALREHKDAPEYSYRSYSWLFRAFRLPAATYIFTSVDRLDSNERRLAGKVYRHINNAGLGFRALNDPSHAKGRYRLLRALFDAGINKFNAYLAVEQPKPTKFPVFVRRNSMSTAPLTGLIMSQHELEVSLNNFEKMGEPLDDLVVIEYNAREVAPNVFQKWSAYNAGGSISLNYAISECNWLVKYGEIDIIGHHFYEREFELLQSNAFEKQVRKVFEIADIEYGRVDFGLVEGEPQFYEVNFNPEFRTTEAKSLVERRILNVRFAVQRRVEHIAKLNTDAVGAVNNIADPDIAAFRLRIWRNYAPQRY